MSKERFSVGYVAGAHGIQGDVRIHLLDPKSEALAAGSTVALVRRDSGEEVGTFTIERLDPVPGKGGRCRGALEGVRGRDRAEALRGCTIFVSRADLPPLEEDEFYLADAIGKQVFATRADGSATPVGKIAGLMTTGSQDLFEVEFTNAKGRVEQWLLPVLPDFVREVADEGVLVDLPSGMLPEELEES